VKIKEVFRKALKATSFSFGSRMSQVQILPPRPIEIYLKRPRNAKNPPAVLFFPKGFAKKIEQFS
jgi:hypothetical protein